MAEDPRVLNYLARYKELEIEKMPWNTLYQILAETLLTRKSNFTSTFMPGDFLQEDVFDNTGQFAAYTAASTFLSILWPDSSRTFAIRPVRRLRGVPGVEKYFNFVTDEMRTHMDAPRAGLSMALMEHFLEEVIFGTSGVGAFEGPPSDSSTPVVYDAWSIKTMCISENAQGFVDTIFIKRCRTVRQIMQEYKNDVIAQQVKELFAAGKLEEKVEVLILLEPKEAEEGKKGVAGMTCRTLHIDFENRIIMREKGYAEMPVFVARMFKTMDEPYGRSSGMIALPDSLSLNALREAVLVASEKQLDPPLGVLDDGRLGGGVINTSAGAISVFNASGRLGNEKPIFPLFTVGEFNSAKDLAEQLKQSIMQAFFLDRLLDLNNQTRMTAFETSVRNRMRGESLGSLFARQEAEVLTPLIQRTFNILYRAGRLGVVDNSTMGKAKQLWGKILGKDEMIVPEVVVKAAEAGLDVFEIEYISPAKRFMQSEKLQGILTTTDFLVQVGQIVPGLLDNVDPDLIMAHVVKFSGAPGDILRTRDEVAKLRAALAERQNAVEKIEAVKQISEVGRNAAQAQSALNGAGAGGR